MPGGYAIVGDRLPGSQFMPTLANAAIFALTRQTVDQIFGEPNDLVVAVSSQWGFGGAVDTRALYASTVHSSSYLAPISIGVFSEPSNPNIHARVAGLLNSNGGEFRCFPSPRDLRSPDVRELTVQPPALIAERPGVRLISPVNGSVVQQAAGVRLAITAEPVDSASLRSVLFVVGNSFTVSGELSSTRTYTASVELPATVPLGSLNVVALATDVSDRLSADHVQITVTPSGQPIALTADPPALVMPSGTEVPQQLRVLGTYARGGATATFDIAAASLGTRYTTRNGSIVRVSADGLVTRVAPGEDTIEVRNGIHVIEVPVVVECAYAAAAAAASFSSSGGTSDVTVTPDGSSCASTITSEVDWITLAGPASATGNTSYRFSVAPNTNVESRTGILRVVGSDQTIAITISQTGLPCEYSVSPPVDDAAATGDTGSITVTTRSGCAWTATSDSTWLTLSGAGGNGSGSITWTAAQNSATASRVATLTIAGQNVLIDQAGATITTPHHLASHVLGSRLTLTWSAPTAGLAPFEYLIEVGRAATLADIGTFPTGRTTTFTAEHVPVGTYYIRVRAMNAFGIISGVSNEIRASIAAPSAPGLPTDLRATVTGSTATFAWTAPATGGTPTTDVVEAGLTPGSSALATFETGTTQTTFVATAVPNGTYYLRVRAKNAAGASGPSNEITVNVGSPTCTRGPGPPSNLQSSVSGRIVTLTWAPATNSTIAYQIEVGSAQGLSNLALLNTGSTGTTFTAVAPPGTYFVRVRALNTCGRSMSSEEVVLIVP